MTTIAPELEAAAALLAAADDDDARQRMLKQLSMRAAAITPDEAIGAPPISTLGDFLDTPVEIPPVLVEPAVLVRGAIYVVSGKPGKGKTTLLLNQLLSWASGRKSFDGLDLFTPTQPLRSLIIENEGAGGMFHRDIGVMLNKGPLDADEKKLARENVLIWGDGGYAGFKLDDAGLVATLRRGIEQFNPDLVFLEPFAGLWDGDENSNSEMRTVLNTLQAIAAEHNIGVMLSHHDRKSGAGDDGDKMDASRGAGALSGAVAFMAHHSEAKAGAERQWECSKNRYGQRPPLVRLQYQVENGWYTHIPEEAGEREILQALLDVAPEPMYLNDLAAELEETKARLRKLLKALVEDGRVKKTPSISNGTGSTGVGYRAVNRDNGDGGLGI